MKPFSWIIQVGPIKSPFLAEVRVRCNCEESERHNDADFEGRGRGWELRDMGDLENLEKARKQISL